MEHQRKAGLVDPAELLHDHARVEEVASRAFVLRLEPWAKETRIPCLSPHLPIDDACLDPAHLVRDDFSLEESPERLSEELVLLFVERAIHWSSTPTHSRQQAVLLLSAGSVP